MKKLTLRLPDELHQEAENYAQKIGLSLNGLALVALADYLRIRANSEREVAKREPAVPEPETPPDFWDQQEPPVIQNQNRKRHKSKR